MVPSNELLFVQEAFALRQGTCHLGARRSARPQHVERTPSLSG